MNVYEAHQQSGGHTKDVQKLKDRLRHNGKVLKELRGKLDQWLLVRVDKRLPVRPRTGRHEATRTALAVRVASCLPVRGRTGSLVSTSTGPYD
ncbi:hypothetical protein DPMN_090489 [Dreissena polymorpha]|uniref:Uncharacterized protein n=1 Tax=Dreissena polymorpha TaxID=45954 RepID=A0A9D4KYR0_DREPO|nr:hypothetical protein DPMN_090489 [Dreissena polymorpha]